jgi:2-polyprenyl-3-methyl-5-hydroxy-6-metoxy-1,4-benzoquinol methylase
LRPISQLAPQEMAQAKTPEFDQFADNYQRVHSENVRVTGESSEYFAQYKAQYIARRMGAKFSGRVLDYGCGVGMLSGFLKEIFPQATVDGYDVSEASIAKVDAAVRAAGTFTSDWRQIISHYDLITVTNVMHHIPPAQRQETIESLKKRLAPGGVLIIVEHNPLNPLTRWAVANCAFDGDAILLPTKETTGYLRRSGMEVMRRDYIVFFPRPLAWLRPFEPQLSWCLAGAQYAVMARRSALSPI